jgi:hypothetical protein
VPKQEVFWQTLPILSGPELRKNSTESADVHSATLEMSKQRGVATMRYRIASFFSAAMLLALFMSSTVHAAVVQLNGTDAVSVKDLDVNGVLYDVFFINGTYNSIKQTNDFIFLGSYDQALSLAYSLGDVLDAAGAITVGGGWNSYAIPYEELTDNVNVWLSQYDLNSDGTWAEQPLSFDRDGVLSNYAVFQLSEVPLPAGLWLLGSGFVLLGCFRRRISA